jgi:hypothetical protein
MSDKDKKLADSIVDELLSGSSAKERPEEKDLSSDIVNELLGGDVTPKVVEPPKPETTSVGQDILRSLRDAAYSAQSGLFTGLSAIPGVFGDVETLGRQAGAAMGYDVDPDSVFPTTKEYTEMAIPKALGATYVPETTTGRMVKTPVEFGTAMLGGGPFVKGGKEFFKALGKNVATELPSVAGPSLARQALQSAPLRIGAPAGLISGGTTELTDSEVAGGLAGGTAAVVKSLVDARTRPASAARMMREALQGVDIPAGRTIESQARRIGVPLTAAETLDAPKLLTLAEDVAKSKAGRAILAPRLAGRTDEISEAAKRGLLEVDEAPIRPTGMAREAQETAAEAVRRLEKQRTEISQAAGYGRLAEGSVPKEDVVELLKSAEEVLKLAPRGTRSTNRKAANTFKDMLRRFETKKVKDPKTGKMKSQRVMVTTENAETLEQVRREMQKMVNADSGIAGTIGPLVTDLKRILEKVPQYAAGKKAHKDFSNTVIKDFTDTGIRSLAQQGVNPKTVANLVSDPELVRPIDINKIADAMNDVDPTVFPKIAKFLIESEIDKAVAKAKPGEKAAKALRGTGLVGENLNAVLRGVAKAKGQDSEQLVTGINNMLDILGRTTKVPQFSGMKPPAPDVPGSLAGAIKRLTGVEVTRPAGLLSEVIEKPSEVAYRTIAKALASDDSIDAVIRLANMNPSSQLAKNLVGSLMGTSAASQSGLLAGE